MLTSEQVATSFVSNVMTKLLFYCPMSMPTVHDDGSWIGETQLRRPPLRNFLSGCKLGQFRLDLRF